MRIPTTLSGVELVVHTVDVGLDTVPAQFEVQEHLAAEAEFIEQTNAEVHAIAVVSHRTTEASTCEGDEVPYTVGVVAQQHVAHIEEGVLIEEPVLVEETMCVAIH